MALTITRIARLFIARNLSHIFRKGQFLVIYAEPSFYGDALGREAPGYSRTVYRASVGTDP